MARKTIRKVLRRPSVRKKKKVVQTLSGLSPEKRLLHRVKRRGQQAVARAKRYPKAHAIAAGTGLIGYSSGKRKGRKQREYY